VQLPKAIVLRNVHSLRDAIADAMAMHELTKSLGETPDG
jgi:hypothetical protein